MAGSANAYPQEWREALVAYLACTLSKLTDYSSAVCSWHNSGEKLRQTFARFALPMVWDYCEVNTLSDTSGGFTAMAGWVTRALEHAVAATAAAPDPVIHSRSAIDMRVDGVDVVCTDPPYYDAIPYSDLIDFFHVWLRRTVHGISPETDAAFAAPLGPKWDREANDGELVDQPNRFNADVSASRMHTSTACFACFGTATTRCARRVGWWSCSPTSSRPPGRRWSRR